MDILKYLIIVLSLFLLGSSSNQPVLKIIRYPQLIVYEPKEKFSAEVVIYLHGGCSSPKKRCHLFANQVTSKGKWLLCPGAKTKCQKPGRIWNLKKANKTIEDSLDIVRAMYPNRIVENNRTVIGFSMGSFVAADLIQNDNKYSKAIIFSGFVALNPNKIQNKEIVLGAGKQDLTFSYLKKLNKKLKIKNINSSFINLGNIGHDLPKDVGKHYE